MMLFINLDLIFFQANAGAVAVARTGPPSVLAGSLSSGSWQKLHDIVGFAIVGRHQLLANNRSGIL